MASNPRLKCQNAFSLWQYNLKPDGRLYLKCARRLMLLLRTKPLCNLFIDNRFLKQFVSRNVVIGKRKVHINTIHNKLSINTSFVPFFFFILTFSTIHQRILFSLGSTVFQHNISDRFHLLLKLSHWFCFGGQSDQCIDQFIALRSLSPPPPHTHSKMPMGCQEGGDCFLKENKWLLQLRQWFMQGFVDRFQWGNFVNNMQRKINEITQYFLNKKDCITFLLQKLTM